MQQIFSTDDVDPRERFNYWMDVVCRTALLVDSYTDACSAFSASIHAAALGQTTLSVFEIGECKIRRDKSEITRAETDDIFVIHQLRGAIEGTTIEHEDVLQPGDIWIYDTNCPFRHDFANTKLVSWKLPRAFLERRLGRMEPLNMRKLRRGASAINLAAGMLKALPKHAASLDGIAVSKVQDSLLDLLTVAYLGDEHSPAATQSYMQMAARFRLKSTIETYLFDARLKACDFAEKAGMTARYANMLLASDRTTLERYIFERRLARSCAVLDSLVFDFRSLSEIAYSHGFANLAHFSRRFKEQYGMTPSEYRAQRTTPSLAA